MTTYFRWSDIQLMLKSKGDALPRSIVLDLHADEVAPNPASTSNSHYIVGPVKVNYTEHVDGGIDVTVETVAELDRSDYRNV